MKLPSAVHSWVDLPSLTSIQYSGSDDDDEGICCNMDLVILESTILFHYLM